MHVNLISELRNPPRWRRPWTEHYGALLERYEEADRLGIGGLWLCEHHFFEDGYCGQPLAVAAAVAVRTARMRIGSGVVVAPLRSPVEIAEQAALVDVLSQGRLVLGIGAGYLRREFRAYGQNRARRYALLEERVHEIRRLWSEDLAMTPVQDEVPIWIGATGPRASAVAGRLGAGLLWLDERLLASYRSGLEDGGHPASAARIGGPIQLILADDPEAAWARIKPHFAYHLESYARYGAEDAEAGGGSGAGDLVDQLTQHIDPEAFRSTGPAMTPPAFDVVTPEEAARRLRAWLGDLPVVEGLFYDSIAGMPEDLVQRHIELLATDLAPAVASLGVETSGGGLGAGV